MSRYSQDSRDRVRDAVDMLALVSTKVELTRRGPDSYFGCCPFHDERSPSFHVRPDEKHYHCFGCSASGDPFTFVMETEGLGFKEALESLADRFGVKLEQVDESPEVAGARQRRERLYTLLDRAATYYERYLWESAEGAVAREYLADRGLDTDTLREFRVGFAPNGWDRIVTVSTQAGFSARELVSAGLAQPKRDRPSELRDRFHGRIMFPTSDARGRVRGFGARILGAEPGGPAGPKYLNSADGELYHKRDVLYGISLARSTAAKVGRMVLVEGYTDVIALHQAGVKNAVGVMGTSLTAEQVGELVRLVGVLDLCLDADSAGQEAMLRAARLCSDSGLDLRVVGLPSGSDPSEILQRDGAERLRASLGTSVPFIAFQVDRILATADLASPDGKDRAIAALGPVLAELPASVLRDDLVRQAAGRLQVTEARLVSLLGAAGGGGGAGGLGGGVAIGGHGEAGHGVGGGAAARGNGVAGSGGEKSHSGGAVTFGALSRTLVAERSFLAMCLAAPAAGAKELAEIDPDELLSDPILRYGARYLKSVDLADPLAGLSAEDADLRVVLEDLVDRARRGGTVGATQLRHARLLLELERLNREISYQRVHGGSDLARLARTRQEIRDQISTVVTQIDRDVHADGSDR